MMGYPGAMFWLLSCTSSELVVPKESSPPVTDSKPADPDDSGDSTPWIDPVEQLPGDCSALYSSDELLDLQLDFLPDDWAGILQDKQTGQKDYHPATFTYKNDSLPVMVRLKGNPSFSWLQDKLQFVVSFNTEDPDARYEGQRKIALDATWYEPTYLKDRLSWWVMRRVEDLPSACANNATLTINGDFYGLYTNIEYFDREWQERNFGEAGATGSLWKYGSEVKTNEETADATRIRAFFRTDNPRELEDLGDTREWLRAWAAEVVLGSDDGFWCCAHNFYMYDHPQRGVLFVPWDFDDNFEVMQYDADPLYGYYDGLFHQPQFDALVEDATWGPVYREELRKVNAAMDPVEVSAQIDLYTAQIHTALEADPNRPTGWEEALQTTERLRGWVWDRHAFLESWLDCEEGRSDQDGDGYGPCEDRNDSDAAFHPGAPELCNWRDDDGNGKVDDNAACDDCIRHDFQDDHRLYCTVPRSWEDAQQNCESHGGKLATIAYESEAIYPVWFQTWPILDPWWLGLNDQARDGSWVDLDGNTAGRSGWAGGEPNGGSAQNCGAWNQAYQAWSSEDCATPSPSICMLP